MKKIRKNLFLLTKEGTRQKDGVLHVLQVGSGRRSGRVQRIHVRVRNETDSLFILFLFLYFLVSDFVLEQNGRVPRRSFFFASDVADAYFLERNDASTRAAKRFADANFDGSHPRLHFVLFFETE